MTNNPQATQWALTHSKCMFCGAKAKVPLDRAVRLAHALYGGAGSTLALLDCTLFSESPQKARFEMRDLTGTVEIVQSQRTADNNPCACGGPGTVRFTGHLCPCSDAVLCEQRGDRMFCFPCFDRFTKVQPGANTKAAR